MTFNPDLHDLDPKTGFMLHKEGGGRVGIDSAVNHRPTGFDPDRPESVSSEFPKFVVPHFGHVVRSGDTVSTPAFPEFHVERSGLLKVLVKDAEEEARALADPAVKAGDTTTATSGFPPVAPPISPGAGPT